MNHDEEVQLLQQLIALRLLKRPFLDDARTSMAVTAYTDAARFDAERGHIFRRLPIMVAHVSELDGVDRFVRRTSPGPAAVVDAR